MVEYGSTNIPKNNEKRNPPPVIFGIALGETSYLDYKPDTKLKVPQNDLLVFLDKWR